MDLSNYVTKDELYAVERELVNKIIYTNSKTRTYIVYSIITMVLASTLFTFILLQGALGRIEIQLKNVHSELQQIEHNNTHIVSIDTVFDNTLTVQNPNNDYQINEYSSKPNTLSK
jgi:hypothetical protein